MVLTQIIRTGIQIASKYSRRTADIDYKLLRKAGWKRPAARGISHGIFAGTAANYIKDDNGIEPDGSLQDSTRNGFKASGPRKARGRQFSYGRRRRYSNYNSCRHYRPRR